MYSFCFIHFLCFNNFVSVVQNDMSPFCIQKKVWFIFNSKYGPGVDSASNRNEYQVYFLGVKAAGA
jgi:hypothetical protein